MTDKVTDPRRKRLLYQAMHRGTKEADIAVGGFAQTRLPSMSDAQLDEFDRLLGVPDQELYDWIVGRVDVPAPYAGDVMTMMKDHPIADTLARRLREGVN